MARLSPNYSTYGVLYTFTVATNNSESSSSNPSGVLGICPSGWHIPSGSEWEELGLSLQENSVAGGKLKETGTTHWSSPNTGASDETGFRALTGGIYWSEPGSFTAIGEYGFWWTSQYHCNYSLNPGGVPVIESWSGSIVFLSYDNDSLGFSNNNFKNDLSVRCVKD